jgi:peroxiredoxin
MNTDKTGLVGQQAPDFDAMTTSGREVKLSGYWHDKPVVAVFLRHFGCTFCRTQVIELTRTYLKFQDLGAEIVCIAMGTPQAGKAFEIMFDVPFPILTIGETDTTPYELYKLGKGSWGQLLGIASFVNGFKAMSKLKGKTVGNIVGDGKQMPGTFIIDTQGIVQFAYISQNASDNPPTNLLLGALSKVTGGIPLHVEVSQSAISSK